VIKVKPLRSLLSLFLGTAILVGCSGSLSKAQLTKLLEDNPDILASAIKKNPTQFMDAIVFAQQEARKGQAADQAKKMEEEREKFFKDPLKPYIGPEQAFRGAKEAKVTVIEYTDFECPFCARGSDTMAAIKQKYPDNVRVTVKHLPLPFHAKAMISAQYYEALRMQNPEAAWEFHDALFASQDKLRADGEKHLKTLAGGLKTKVNMAKLATDVKSDAVKKKIQSDMDEANKFEFRGTPAFLVNGVPIRGALPPEEFSKVIDRHLGKG
jgi:protein-disulfide isomerase